MKIVALILQGSETSIVTLTSSVTLLKYGKQRRSDGIWIQLWVCRLQGVSWFFCVSTSLHFCNSFWVFIAFLYSEQFSTEIGRKRINWFNAYNLIVLYIACRRRGMVSWPKSRLLNRSWRCWRELMCSMMHSTYGMMGILEPSITSAWGGFLMYL